MLQRRVKKLVVVVGFSKACNFLTLRLTALLTNNKETYFHKRYLLFLGHITIQRLIKEIFKKNLGAGKIISRGVRVNFIF
jgi:hypothetical protein